MTVVAAGWTGLVEAGFDAPDAVVDLGTGRLYLFKGDMYGRVDHRGDATMPAELAPLFG